MRNHLFFDKLDNPLKKKLIQESANTFTSMTQLGTYVIANHIRFRDGVRAIELAVSEIVDVKSTWSRAHFIWGGRYFFLGSYA